MLALIELKEEFEYYKSRRNYFTESIKELTGILESVKENQPNNWIRIASLENDIKFHKALDQFYKVEIKRLKQIFSSLAA